MPHARREHACVTLNYVPHGHASVDHGTLSRFGCRLWPSTSYALRSILFFPHRVIGTDRFKVFEECGVKRMAAQGRAIADHD